MTQPSRTPASYALLPELFGTSTLTGWLDPDGRAERAALKVAKLQHHVSIAVREYLAQAKKHQKEIPLELGDGWSDGKVSRLLNGHATMSVADMYVLLDICGLTLTAFVVRIGGDDVAPSVREAVIAEYLRERLKTVGEESAGTGQARPSTPAPRR